MSGPRFSGGDGLEPGSTERYVHDFMMLNELRAGEGAYAISSAGLAQSGLSFGPYQWDIGANTHGRALLENIARNAVDENGQRFVSDSDIDAMRSHLYKPTSDFSGDDEAVRRSVVPRLDAALSSPVGVQLVNDDFVTKLREKISAADAVINQISDPSNREAIQTSLFVRLNVLDIQNQYGTEVNRRLAQALDLSEGGGEVSLPHRRSGAEFSVQGPWGVEDVLRFRMETRYAAGIDDSSSRDALRRVSSLVSVVGVDNIVLDEDDRRYLVSGLPAQLREHGRDPAILQDASLQPLRALSERALRESPDLQQWVRENPTAELTMGNPLVDGRLQKGEKGMQVEALQIQLSSLGYTRANGQPLGVDGDFGAGTSHAVKAFQTDKALPVTGVADEATRQAIDRAALEALRDLPPTPGQAPQRQAPSLNPAQRVEDALYAPLREQVYAMDRVMGRTPDDASDRVAAALCAECRANGLTRVDGVVLGQKGGSAQPGEYVFAYSGSSERPSDWVGVRTAEAVQTPVEQSLAKAEMLQHQQAVEAQRYAQQQQQANDAPVRSMS